MFSKKIDFLAIGDTVVDAFIKLKEAHVTCNINKENCEICMKFADKIPFESATVVSAVGNSPNAAVSASRLGLSSALLSDIGDDGYSRDCLTSLKNNGVSTKYMTTHGHMKTNYHYVLWYGDERTILVNHEEYPRKFPALSTPRYIYLSSLGSNSESYHNELADYLAKNSEVKLAFQPGTFQIKLGYEKLKRIYERTFVFFCNKEEAQRILGSKEEDSKKLMDMLRTRGPKVIVMTDGPKGAYAYDGTNTYFMPPYPDPKSPYERTGAGDAFSSTLTVALALGKSLEEALMWAPINSASVVQHIGAQEGLLTQKELLEWLARAPSDYKPQKI